jgi:hypothetical protein
MKHLSTPGGYGGWYELAPNSDSLQYVSEITFKLGNPELLQARPSYLVLRRRTTWLVLPWLPVEPLLPGVGMAEARPTPRPQQQQQLLMMTTMTTMTMTMTMKRMVSRFAPGLYMRFPTLSRLSVFAAAAAAMCAVRSHPQAHLTVDPNT